MKHTFSIDALNAQGDQGWRLTKTETWRAGSFGSSLKTHDMRIGKAGDVAVWMGRKLRPHKENGLQPLDKPHWWSILSQGIFSHPILHRFSPSPLPDQQQLKDTIHKHVPGSPWLVYLDISGHFQAMDTSIISILNNPYIVVRNEITSSVGYIGEKAASSEGYVEDLFIKFLSGWKQHLTTGRIAIFAPEKEETNIESLVQWIRDWTPEPA